MAIPHTLQKQRIEQRLAGLSGKPRIAEIRNILGELPRWNTGPYGALKKWLRAEISIATKRGAVTHTDGFAVKRQGKRQFVLVGQPSAGKSSLLHALCGVQTKIAAYAFTTLRPVPGMVDVCGTQMQLIDLPGVVRGACDDVGQGTRVLSVIRSADAAVLVLDATKPVDEALVVERELARASVPSPRFVIANKADLVHAYPGFVARLAQHFPDRDIVLASAHTQEGLQAVRNALWRAAGLIRVFTQDAERPVILDEGSTVRDLASALHTDMPARVQQYRVTGLSVAFPRMPVQASHVLADEDCVTLVLRR